MSALDTQAASCLEPCTDLVVLLDTASPCSHRLRTWEERPSLELALALPLPLVLRQAMLATRGALVAPLERFRSSYCIYASFHFNTLRYVNLQVTLIGLRLLVGGL